MKRKIPSLLDYPNKERLEEEEMLLFLQSVKASGRNF